MLCEHRKGCKIWHGFHENQVPQRLWWTLGVFLCGGDIRPPYIFEQGLKLNLDGYMKLLGTGQFLAGKGYYCAAIRVAAGFRSLSIHPEIVRSGYQRISVTSPAPTFLASLPNCDSTDYYVWAAVEKDTNHLAWNTKVKEVFKEIPRGTERKVCVRFKCLFEAILMEAEDGCFE